MYIIMKVKNKDKKEDKKKNRGSSVVEVVLIIIVIIALVLIFQGKVKEFVSSGLDNLDTHTDTLLDTEGY